jgi:hypothetical protein
MGSTSGIETVARAPKASVARLEAGDNVSPLKLVLPHASFARSLEGG